MLKFVKKLNVSASDFYNTILLSLTKDIKQATGKNIAITDLDYGYKCQKRIRRKGKLVESNIDIKRPVLNKEIMTIITVKKEVYELKYTIEELDDNLIRVTHTQTGSVSDNFFNKILFRIRTKKRFKEIENYIKKTGKEA